MEKLIPEAKTPILQLITTSNCLYVQMNVKSLVYDFCFPENIKIWQGFLFKVGIPNSNYKNLLLPVSDSESDQQDLLNIEILSNAIPIIELVGGDNFPILFHPHFFVGHDKTLRRNTNGTWYDYKRQGFEKKLGDYLLRMAHSLNYDEGYIDVTYSANKNALSFYEKHRYKFPIDNVQLPVRFPSGKTFEFKSFDERNKTHSKFQIQDNQTDSQIYNIQTTDNKLSPRRKLKFKIIGFKPPYSPKEKQKSDFKILEENSSDYRHNSDRSFFRNIGKCMGLREKASDKLYEFYLTKTAFNIISEHIGWGEKTEDNKVEQGGILLGHAFIDPDTKLTYSIAEQAIEARLARGTAGYLEVTHETWKEMLDRVDRLYTDIQIIGWYHTHPNQLDVFMSDTDKNTQERLFYNDWQFAIVLNPQKKIWRAFYGSRSDECKGFVIQDNED